VTIDIPSGWEWDTERAHQAPTEAPQHVLDLIDPDSSADFPLPSAHMPRPPAKPGFFGPPGTRVTALNARSRLGGPHAPAAPNIGRNRPSTCSFSPISQTFSNSSRAFIIIDVPHRVRSSADDLGRSFYHNQFEKLLRTAPLGLSTTSDFTHGHTDIQNHHSAYDSRRTAWVWPQTASRKFSVPQKVISRTRLLRPIFLGSASRIFNYYTLCKRRT
jgi:hypothetical protein